MTLLAQSASKSEDFVNGKRKIVVIDSDDDEGEVVNQAPADLDRRMQQAGLILSDDSDDEVVVKRPRKQEVIELDSDSEGGDEFNDSNDKIEKVLMSCENLSSKLLTALKTWRQEETETNDNTGCVALESTNSSLITQGDIEGLASHLILKPYQLAGVNWLYLLYQHGVSGVLADDMGLGKTVQTIAFLAYLKTIQPGHQTQLIIVPASVLSNWKREFENFAPNMRVALYHGSVNERYDLQDELQDSSSFDVLITTYSYFQSDSCVRDRKFLSRHRFTYCILDEGHNIKNSKSSRFKRINNLRTEYRIILSGTPVQNSTQELLTLLSFLMPGLFDLENESILEYFDNRSSSNHMDMKNIRKILSPFILRRIKSQVLKQLPERSIQVEFVEVNENQKSLCDLIISDARGQKKKVEEMKASLKAAKKNGLGLISQLVGAPAQQASTDDGKYDAYSIFTNLRKAANHPILVQKIFADPEILNKMAHALHRAGEFGTTCTFDMVLSEISGYSDFELHQLCCQYSYHQVLKQYILSPEQLFGSAKLQKLRSLLSELKQKGHRVLLFSQWQKLLDIFEPFMEHLGYRYLRLDGSTNVKERQALIDKYTSNPDIFVFLLTTRAGGLGINLTAADTVILHDLDFNPTIDDQACDRCYRIGQTKPVSIYKLVSKDTVDEHIYRIGLRKNNLNQALLGGQKSSKQDRSVALGILDSILNGSI